MTADDSLYVLQVENDRTAAKVFRWLNSESLVLEDTYNAGWRFRAKSCPTFGGIDELADRIRTVEGTDNRFVVRGHPRAYTGTVVNRRYRDHHDNPHWEQHPEGRRWLMVDLDDLPAPEWLPCDPDSDALRRAIRYATEQLPACFHDVTTFYQWSSSAGLAKRTETDEGKKKYRLAWGDLRLHLWYWCDRRAYTHSIREWFQTFKADTGVPVDPKLYNPVQPHFVGAPTFRNGPDPLAGCRSGLLHGGADTVELPDAVLTGSEYRERERKRAERRGRERERLKSTPRRRSRAQMDGAQSRYAKAALANAIDTVRSAPKGTRHNTLSEQSFSMGTLVGAGALQGAETLRLLADAAVANGLPKKEAKRTVRDGLEAGENSPRDLTTVRREGDSKGGQQRRSEPERETTQNGPSDTDSNPGPSIDELRGYFSSGDSPEDDDESEAWTLEKINPDPDYSEAVEERAAVMEYHGELGRDDAERRARESTAPAGDDQPNERGHEHRERLRTALRELDTLPAGERSVYRALAYEADTGPGSEAMVRFTASWAGWSVEDLRCEHKKAAATADTAAAS